VVFTARITTKVVSPTTTAAMGSPPDFPRLSDSCSFGFVRCMTWAIFGLSALFLA